MQLVFNNAVLYVVEYPAQDAVEVIDKRHGVGAFMHGAAAQRFRDEFRVFVEQERDVEAFEDFIDHYQALMTQPAVLH